MLEAIFWIFWSLVVVSILSFGGILFVGAPYMPTLKSSAQRALRLLDLKEGQTLYELGSGDGVMLKIAAEHGLNVVGYELNPFLAVLSYLRTWKYRSQISIKCQNFWKADLSKSDGVYVFLLDRFMPELEAKLSREVNDRPIKVVSHAFKIPGKKADKRSGAMFLYTFR